MREGQEGTAPAQPAWARPEDVRQAVLPLQTQSAGAAGNAETGTEQQAGAATS